MDISTHKVLIGTINSFFIVDEAYRLGSCQFATAAIFVCFDCCSCQKHNPNNINVQLRELRGRSARCFPVVHKLLLMLLSNSD